MAVAGGPNIVEDGLVLALDAANVKSYQSGSTVWNDLTSNNISASLVNGPSFVDENGGVLDFDGSNDYVEATANLSTLTNLSEGTIEIVFSWDSGDGTTLLHLHAGSSFYGTNVGLGSWTGSTNDESIFIYVFQADGTGNVISYRDGELKYRDGQYHHIIFTESTANGVSMYVDGVEVNLGGELSAFTPTTVTKLQIGRRAYDASTTIHGGKIPLVRIYNRALTAEEAINNFNAIKGRFGL